MPLCRLVFKFVAPIGSCVWTLFSTFIIVVVVVVVEDGGPWRALFESKGGKLLFREFPKGCWKDTGGCGMG